jgi:hypothetical protein
MRDDGLLVVKAVLMGRAIALQNLLYPMYFCNCKLDVAGYDRSALDS